MWVPVTMEESQLEERERKEKGLRDNKIMSEVGYKNHLQCQNLLPNQILICNRRQIIPSDLEVRITL
jgi:hypothetical protein